ncbi:MAG: acetate/propionate family kinase [Leptospirales bacterium]
MRILVANPGSSTLKLSIREGEKTLSPHTVELHENPELLDRALRDWLDSKEGQQADGCGVRVVHGGSAFHGPVRITEGVLETLRSLSPLAPLHMEGALRTIGSVKRTLPHLPIVASFDTSFHSTIPPEGFHYAVPGQWFREWGVRKYGFHGLSYTWLSHRLRSLVTEEIRSKTVALHLGNGASACAIQDGKSIDTTMGMTPMDGLVMGTRSGTLDPGIVFYLQRIGIPIQRIEDDLNHQSGLLGVSGISSDYRAVETAAKEGNPDARMAIRMAARRTAGAVASLAVPLEGLTCLVFTGGIGEHAPGFREEVCRMIAFMGVCLDPEKNRAFPHADTQDRCISREDSPVSVWVIGTQEDWSIARDVSQVLRKTR